MVHQKTLDPILAQGKSDGNSFVGIAQNF